MGRGGKLVVVSGPSGAGKTSVCRALKKYPGVIFSVSATTRPQRSGEQAGVDYHFVSTGEFERRLAKGEFLESAKYGRYHYGTPRAPMEEALASGEVFVVEIDVQGTRQLREAKVEGVFVFVVPPGIDALRQRLTGRGTDSAEEIEERLAIAAEELQAAELYDHVLVNENLDRTIRELADIIGL